MRLLSSIKQLVVPAGSTPRRVKAGLFRGLTLQVDLSSQTQLYLGLFERELLRWFRKAGADIETAIDIGAGEGEYSLYFLSKTKASRVLAFEPTEDRRRIFKENLELNGLRNDSRLILSEHFVGSSAINSQVTLDSLLSLISPPSLIKMDIDGGELEVLQGAQALLNGGRSYWIVETHSIDLERDCIAQFQAANYRTVVVPNAWWRVFVPELRPIRHNRWLVAFPS
jgi:hypothetical protein